MFVIDPAARIEERSRRWGDVMMDVDDGKMREVLYEIGIQSGRIKYVRMRLVVVVMILIVECRKYTPSVMLSSHPRTCTLSLLLT